MKRIVRVRTPLALRYSDYDLEFDPSAIYQFFYESLCRRSFELSFCKPSMVPDFSEAILENLVKMFANMELRNTTAQNLHCDQLKQSGIPWTRIFSNNTCFYCVRRKPEHVLTCGHGICETCIHTFGHAEAAVEYSYRIGACLLCGSGTLRVTLKPSTAGVRLLSIDGGGVRGVIPLEFLVLLQNELGSACKVQDLFDLAFGTSSGKPTSLEVRGTDDY